MIVGLCGHKRVGKDTVAKRLESHGFKQIALADPIKFIAMVTFGWTDEMVYGKNGYDREKIEEEWGFSVRHALERIGTEMGRNLHEDVWVRKVIAHAKEVHPQRIVVSDVRFHNEARAIRKNGGVIWKIVRPDFSGDARHASEMEIDDIEANYTLHNDGTIEELEAKVDKIAEVLEWT